MFIANLLESLERRLVVVYPGRFQPFHLGHAAVFEKLQGKFGRDNVFIATTPQVKIDEKNPFNFTEKVALIHAAGVPDNHIAQVTQPYDITAVQQALGFNPNNTVLIFAVGEPDRDRLGVDQTYTEFTPTGRKSKIPDGKQVGDDKPFKTFQGLDQSVTVAQGHAYVVIVPEIEKAITINGKKVDVSHGTECRNLWNTIRNDQTARKEFLTQLYGRATPELAHIFDRIPAPATATEPPQNLAKQPKPVKPAGGMQVEPVKPAVSEEAAGVGVVAKNKSMAKDPRYSMSMSVDVGPGTPGKNLRAFNLAEQEREPYQQAIDTLTLRWIERMNDEIDEIKERLSTEQLPANYREALKQKIEKIKAERAKLLFNPQ
jgi:FtsZ-binding cell division protein ZapB